MVYTRNFDLFLRYYNEARKISPPQWEEKKEIVVSNTTFNFAENHAQDKILFETSFIPYSELKVRV